LGGVQEKRLTQEKVLTIIKESSNVQRTKKEARPKQKLWEERVHPERKGEGLRKKKKLKKGRSRALLSKKKLGGKDERGKGHHTHTQNTTDYTQERG